MSSSMRVWVVMLAFGSVVGLASAPALAGAGDVGEKGEQLYIWHLDEGSGEEVAEAGGDGPVGVFVGDVEWTDGVSEGGVALARVQGDAQYIEFAGDDHLDITEELTLAAWVTLDAHPAGDQANKGTLYFKNTYYLQVEPPDGTLAYYFYDTAPEGYHVSSVPIPTGEWAHIALVWDGSVVRYYINGEQDPTEIDQSGPGKSTPGKTLRVGGEDGACCPRFFVGAVDDLAIANYALTENELAALMTEALSVEPRGKLATRWGALRAR
jgi:hypothetical protein